MMSHGTVYLKCYWCSHHFTFGLWIWKLWCLRLFKLQPYRWSWNKRIITFTLFNWRLMQYALPKASYIAIYTNDSYALNIYSNAPKSKRNLSQSRKVRKEGQGKEEGENGSKWVASSGANPLALPFFKIFASFAPLREIFPSSQFHCSSSSGLGDS